MLSAIHEYFSYVVVVATGLAGLWALLAHWLDSLRHRYLWWLTAFAHFSIGVQAIFGLILIAGQGKELDGFHLFYGALALATAGIIYSYRSQLSSKKYLLYGLGGLFLMGLVIRAMLIGTS